MILALDLGVNTGFCRRTGDEIDESGKWELDKGGNASKAFKYKEFIRHLNEELANSPIKLLAYEEVRRHMGTKAAHAFGGFLAQLQIFSEDNRIELQPFEVGAIKKIATGRGNANKCAMIVAATKKWPDIDVESDDEADALFISELARKHQIKEKRKESNAEKDNSNETDQQGDRGEQDE